MKAGVAPNCNNRRNTSFRLSPDHSADSVFKSPAAFFWLVLHGLCCIVSLVLGFRFSKLIFLLIFASSNNSPEASYHRPGSRLLGLEGTRGVASELNRPFDSIANPVGNPRSNPNPDQGKSSRVHVGRHGILIRPWPHPDPNEVMKAHQLLERVQQEQRMIYGVRDWRPVIVITPTYLRTFQSVHLTGLMHTLMLVPGKVVWIVVEAGGVSNETSALLHKTGLDVIHVGFNERMPVSWEDRHRMEVRMRVQGLRVVREKKMDGIVLFADDSNTHSLELFDEIQSVKWMGALSVGILVHPGHSEILHKQESEGRKVGMEETEGEGNVLLPVQGPACNSSGHLVGWHTFNSIPYAKRSARYIDDMATILPRRLEWAGFALNAKLVWEDSDKPSWVHDWDDWTTDGQRIESPLSILKDDSFVEPLGRCGRNILLWWLRVEARADSKFPPRWIIDPPLEVVVPAKRTPWPDPPVHPHEVSVQGDNTTPDHTEKQRGRKSSRSKKNKRKRDIQNEAQQVSRVSERDGTGR
uniref:Glycosyltransferases n=1 Tax=Araucaria cunninghamii TaxID=56994 RepID=A0A0D6R8M4_ARACU